MTRRDLLLAEIAELEALIAHWQSDGTEAITDPDLQWAKALLEHCLAKRKSLLLADLH